MNHAAEDIQRQGILPIIHAKDLEQAAGAAGALAKENLKVQEFLWENENTGKLLKEVQETCRDIQVGCSGIRNPEEVEKAAEAGAKFLVISIRDESALKLGKEMGLTVFPLAETGEEIDTAVRQGFDRICVEPIENLGGENLFYELKKMYPGIRFMPRGMILAETAEDYLSFSNVFSCAGSWLAPKNLMETSDWEKIKELAKRSVYEMLGFGILSIDFSELSEAENTAGQLDKIFCLEDTITFSKEQFWENTSVRLTISTNHIKRSVAYLESKGLRFRVEDAPKNANGGYPYVYLSDTVNGVSVRLFQKNSRKDG